jgi:hypothetical protein
MDELRESSLLFSIEGLLETERERVQREAREAERRREEELKRVADAAERRRVALERESEARARRVAIEQERAKLEEERLESLRRATVERARVEAESRLRLIEAEERRKHELSLAKLRGDARVARYGAFAWICFGSVAVVLTAALGAYVGWVRPARAQDAQRLQALQAEARLRQQADEQVLRRERAESRALRERVLELEARPPIAAAPSASAVKKPTAVPAASASGGQAKKVRCRETGDPLDDCLGGP